ncbi:MAG: hypothetical protein R6U04_00630 [Bacteroidales bacterium]
MKDLFRKYSVSFLFLMVVIIFNNTTAHAEDDDYDCKFYNAYISGDMSEWPDWISEMEQAYSKNNSTETLKDIVVAYYGYVAWLIGVDREGEAENYIDKAEHYISELSEYSSYKSYAEAMQGAFLAYRISLNKSRAIYLGPRSIRHINRAIELDSDNPYAWVEKGNAAYHMPRAIGGSYKEAAEHFKKAIDGLEEGSSTPECNWVYLNAMAWLAQSYDNTGEVDKAFKVYEKILSIEPNFQWIRDELYPEFKERVR